MAYNANETLWTPGRRHAGNELETEFDAGVTALSNGTIIAADFSPRAALAPWNFQNALTPGCPVFRAWGFTVLAAGVELRLGGDFQARRIRYRLVQLQGFLAAVAANDIRFRLFSVDEAGTEVQFGSNVTIVAGALQQNVAVAAAIVPRERRLRVYISAPGAVADFTVRQAFLVARLRRFWVA